MSSPLEPKAFRGDGVEIDLKTGKPKYASPLNREEETKQKIKLLVLNFAKGYVRDGDREKELEAMKWAEDFIDQYAHQVATEATKTLQAKVKAQEMFTKDAIREARIDENKYWKRRIGEHSDEDTSCYDNRIAELEKEREQNVRNQQ